MFKQLTPQRIQHDSGYIVQTGGRYSIQYIDGDLTAELDADFAPVTGLYPESMSIRKGENAPIAPTLDERDLILKRILNGLEFWKMKYEICKGRPFNT